MSDTKQTESDGKVIRILMLEDDAADAELIIYALREGGISFTQERVETEKAFVGKLNEGRFDLILSDYALPSFDGYAALNLAQKKCPHVPFIFVTGTLGEEVAIETLKSGATDYVLKTRLSRLVPAVHRALRETEEREERRRAEEKLRDYHQQLRALSTYLQYVREEERTRIAREVHDELGQALTGLKMDLSWLATRLPKSEENLAKKAEFMMQQIDGTIQTVRRISTELRPGILDDLGLADALEWQAYEFQNRTGIQCEVTQKTGVAGLDAHRSTAFFRIFQETLTNVIRHAEATRVQVSLAQRENEVILEVKDNGRGISKAEIANVNSIGLLGMRERAAQFGGSVEIHGTSGKGTVVTVRMPLKATVAEQERTDHEDSHSRRPRRRAAGPKANSRGRISKSYVR